MIAKRAFPMFLSTLLLLSLFGCQSKPALDKKAITDSLAASGLEGVISESETSSGTQKEIHYVIRSENSENSTFLAGISAATQSKEPLLYTTFSRKVTLEPIRWEDWKSRIVFATILSGGFADKEEVYRTFAEQTPPEDPTGFTLEAQLSGGYCVLSYGIVRNPLQSSTDAKNAILRVNIYGSYGLYADLKKAVANARQAA